MKKKTIVTTLLSVVIPIILGAVVYFCFRPDTYISHVAQNAGIPVINLGMSGSVIAKFLRNFFPDIAWAYALPNALFLAFGGDRKKVVEIAAVTAIMIAVSEILQFCGIISGTGDLVDIILELCSACMAIVLVRKRVMEE